MEQRPKYFIKGGGGWESPKEILSQLAVKTCRVLTTRILDKLFIDILKTNKGLVRGRATRRLKTRAIQDGWRIMWVRTGGLHVPHVECRKGDGDASPGRWQVSGDQGLDAFSPHDSFLVLYNIPCVLDAFFIF